MSKYLCVLRVTQAHRIHQYFMQWRMNALYLHINGLVKLGFATRVSSLRSFSAMLILHSCEMYLKKSNSPTYTNKYLLPFDSNSRFSFTDAFSALPSPIILYTMRTMDVRVYSYTCIHRFIISTARYTSSTLIMYTCIRILISMFDASLQTVKSDTMQSMV